MATYIKSNCATGCGGDPCACDFFSGFESGDENATFTYDVTGQFIYAHDIAISYLPPPPFLEVQMEIFADSVLIWDSGCIGSNTEITDTVEVPAGTVELQVVITKCTSGTEHDWSFDIVCV